MQGCCEQQQDKDKEIQPHVQARSPIPTLGCSGEHQQQSYKVISSALHPGEEKLSSAQPCPLLTEGTSCLGATSTPCPVGNHLALGSAPHQDQDSKPALFSIGSSQFMLILKIHALTPKPRRVAGIDAKTAPG